MIQSLKRLFTGQSANQLAFFNILGPVILNGINFFTVPIFTRMLGEENYGLISLYTTWVQVLTIVMGLQTCGAIATARVHIDEDQHDAYYSSTLFLSCCFAILVTAGMVIFIRPISAFLGFHWSIVLLMIAQSFGSYVISFATMKFIHHKQASMNFLVSVLVSVASIAISMVAISQIDRFEDRYWGRVIGYVIPNFLVGMVLLLVIFWKGKTAFHREYWKFCLPLCLPLVFHNLSQIVLAQSDRVMIQKLMNDNAAVGIYSLVFNFVHIINIIYGALNNTWVPLYYDQVKQGRMEEVHRHSRNYVVLYTVLTMGFILVAPEGVMLFSAEGFWSGIPLVPIMAVAYYFVFLYSFPVNYEFYHKKTRLIAVGTCLSAAINIALNYFFIRWFSNQGGIGGILGAAIATMLAYFALFLFHHFSAKYRIKEATYYYRISAFLPGVVAVLLTCGVFYLFYMQWNLWYVRWGLGAMLGVYLFIRVFRQKSIF